MPRTKVGGIFGAGSAKTQHVRWPVNQRLRNAGIVDEMPYSIATASRPIRAATSSSRAESGVSTAGLDEVAALIGRLAVAIE